MATLPSANVSISADAGALGGGTGYCIVAGCVERNADLTPRVYSSARALQAQHGYSQGVDYSAIHIEETRKPIIFIALPTATPGQLSRVNSSGMLGTSVISIAAGSAGYLEETRGSIVVDVGGTVGTAGIVILLSLDGGVTEKRIRLGTATSYTVPYVGIVINFAAGTLLAGATYLFTTTAPKWDSAGIAAARLALAAQQKLARSLLIPEEVASDTEAGYVVSSINAYDTSNARFAYARVNVRDRLPLATKSRVLKTMTGTPSITFAAAGFTITRSTGSFIADGFAIGDVVTVAGSTSNNGSKGPITALSATVMTFAAGIANEGPVGTVTITGSEGLVFAATTATRSVGSWLADGFRIGDSVTTSGTASNNGTKVITALTNTVLSYASGGVAETIGSALVTMTKGETMAAWVSLMDAAYASIDGQKRIDLGLGRLRKLSPITGWEFRRPVQWAASVREYQHDLHIPTWRKEDGPLSGWSLEDADGNIVEYDERVDGGALAARFTCARTWGNGPNGAFIAMSLTRATEGSILSLTHNMAVANVGCTVVQQATENFVGKSLVLKDDGTATAAALGVLEEAVNTDLEIALLQEKVIGEGPRASKAVWRANTTDQLNIPDATITGVLDLHVNGTIVHVDTVVKVS